MTHRSSKSLAQGIRFSLSCLLIILASVSFLLFATLIVWIKYEQHALCQMAQRQYQTAECVSALILQLTDEQQSWRQRNRAIWALGQLGDRRALPALSQYCSGMIPAKEPLDEGLSQYELSKAMRWLQGESNLLLRVSRWF